MWFAVMCATCLASCIKGEDTTNTKESNLEALWKLIDEHYCFFEYKEKEMGLNWDAVHEKYLAQVKSGMTNQQLFEVMANMLSELKDGHVNLIAAFDYARNWS